MEIKGIITEFKEEVVFQRKGQTLRRQIVTVASEDRQVLFVELRGTLIDKVTTKLKIKAGDTAIIEFTFMGSQKGEKYYNNIVAKDIRYEWEEK